MAKASEVGFPGGNSDECELLLTWLDYLRDIHVRKLQDLDEEAARWTPPNGLISLLGIMNHLVHVEWRWIDGSMLGKETNRSEEEFRPGPELTVASVIRAYRTRATATNAYVRSTSSMNTPCLLGEGRDLRWVLLHLINETGRHAGHADATRELLDATIGE